MSMLPPLSSSPREVDIITVGEELVEGLRENTHLRAIASRLLAAGLRVRRQLVLRDDFEAVREAVVESRRAGAALVLTGGLGPNVDDGTREAVAAALGLVLETSAEQLAVLRRFLEGQGRELLAGDERQARVFVGGRVLPNPLGSAPGLAYEPADAPPVYLLPGPPGEMLPLLENAVIPALRPAGVPGSGVGRILRTHGVRAATLDARLRPLVPAGVKLTFGTDSGIVDVRLTAEPGPDSLAALESTAARFRALLGEDCFGDDPTTLAESVLRRLAGRGETLAVAESCTGGLIAAALTAVPGSSAWFAGGVVAYAESAKIALLGVPAEVLRACGAVSEPVARAMAEGARSRFATGHAVATTGFAGPAGGTPAAPLGTVFIALAGPQGTTCHRLTMTGSRDQIRARATHAALDLLRRAGGDGAPAARG